MLDKLTSGGSGDWRYGEDHISTGVVLTGPTASQGLCIKALRLLSCISEKVGVGQTK